MTATTQPPIALRDMGSFHIGGRRVDIGGKPVRQVNLTQNGMPITIDPNGTYHVEQMYVQYFLPAEEAGACPLLLWHGGGLSGVTYETTPDGREGWLNYFLRRGWSVYISDAVERGRSGWAPTPDVFKDEPIFLPAHDPFVRFRIGDGPESYHADPAQRRLKPGSQFPNAGYDNFVMQNVPRWPGNDDATIAAYIAEVDRVGPCVLLVHSQSGPFGFKVAQARPDKVKALIAVEPVGGGDPAQAAVLKDIPVLMIYGDFIGSDPRWPTIRATGMAFADKVRAAGGSIDVVDLPKLGVTGNSHMIMMDSNNAEVAALIQRWLEDKGLTASPTESVDKRCTESEITLLTSPHGRGSAPDVAQFIAINRDPSSMHGTKILTEADRLMTVCNSCRYCEGLCAVFPAMEMRRSFSDGDLNYLANLCHACGACYADCQFSPPHEFNVNVPQTLAIARAESYAAYAWPRAFAGMFARNGLAISIIAALSVAAFVFGFAAFNDPSILYGVHTGPGAFYKLMPHNAMAVLFSAVFLYAIVALVMGVRAFWRDIGEPVGMMTGLRALLQALRDAGELRYLHGGGVGCYNEDERPTDRRKLYHHLTFYGFLLCFAATSVATLYHYLLAREAPYPWWDLPVVLGTLGGIGLVIGPVGLLVAKQTRDPDLVDAQRMGMDVAFIVMLWLTGATGLLLLVLRSTSAMGPLLALHLGVVFALFLTMPYGKFVHGIYRYVALVRYARERQGESG